MYIVFEGLDGCGKSTIARHLYEKLVGIGFDCILVAEPTKNSIWGKTVRRNLKNLIDMVPEEEIMYFLLDRIKHVNTVIKPALADGVTVIQDRYYLSTAAYQGNILFTPKELVQMHLYDFQCPEPDLVFFIDTPILSCMERISKRDGAEIVKYDKKDEMERILENFSEIFSNNLVKNWRGISNERELEDAVDTVFKHVVERIP